VEEGPGREEPVGRPWPALDARRAARITTVEHARSLARRTLPRLVFDYIDGGAEAEITMRANRAAIEAVGFLPRMGLTRGRPDLTTTVLGTPVSMPVLLGPVGFTRMIHHRGDVAAARAAGAAGTIFTQSSMSGHTIEEVAAVGPGPKWFQLYFLGGRAGAERLVERAWRAGYTALAVTLDTQIVGNRERDLRNGLRRPLRIDLSNVVRVGPQVAVRPRWLAHFARQGLRLDIVNTSGFAGPGRPMTVDDAVVAMSTYPPTWDDFSWIRGQWPGPVLAKGVVTGDDARRAVASGADAIIVSNHGGRQLDGMAASLPALVEVLDAVGDQVEVLVDGGIRRGSDVARAVALGARATLIGRAWAYGLGAAGQAGVEQVLSILRTDLDRTLRLLGCPSVAALDHRFVARPPAW
jgi:isopentenyl diphosphate isomerase/L-lactate dehydrogenase-like FMN-dependent dehydrogenase